MSQAGKEAMVESFDENVKKEPGKRLYSNINKKLTKMGLLIVIGVALAGGVWLLVWPSNDPTPLAETTDESPKDLSGQPTVSSEMFESLQSSFEKFRDELSDIPNTTESLQNKDAKLSRGFQKLQADIASLTDSNVQIMERLGSIDKKYEAISKELAARKRVKSKSSTPRFDLDVDGIGVWGGTPFVSVGFQGRYIMVEQGQAVNGWVLDVLDPIARTVEFRHRKGTRVKRNV